MSVLKEKGPELRADLTGCFANLFSPSLELPEGEEMLENVCWYASGGYDFKPVVYFSEHYRKQKGPMFEQLTTPSLFIYTCIGSEFEMLDEAVREEKAFYEDDRTSISAKEFHRLRIDREAFGYEINEEYIDNRNEDVLEKVGYDAFLCRLTLTDLLLGVSEDCWILYLACENINFFEQVVHRGFVKVRHLVTMYEGLAFGSCRKSVIEHVYGEPWRREDWPADLLIPETIVTPPDVTMDMLRRASCWHDMHWREIGPCIDRQRGRVLLLDAWEREHDRGFRRIIRRAGGGKRFECRGCIRERSRQTV